MRRPAPALRLLRAGLAAWLFAWFVLGHTLGFYFAVVVRAWPIRQAFFPWPLGEPWLAAVAYLTPATFAVALLRPSMVTLRPAAWIATACAAILLVHADAYNDATYLMGFWLGLWLLHLSTQGHREDDAVVTEASSLLVLLCAFVFLGGVVGKLHREWWDGDVMTHVLVEQREYWFYPWLRTHVAGDAQVLLARWSARMALGCEMLVVAAPLLPLRLGLVTLIVACVGIVACAGWTLLSVVGGPLLAALACLWLMHDGAESGMTHP